MTNCCQCQGIETHFDEKEANKKLKQYHQKGPLKTTQALIDALKAEGVEGMTLLDIGGGIGVIQHELLAAGVTRAMSVEASPAYAEAARAEAERRNYTARLTSYSGNFVDLAAQIPPADLVTLDRVICCYHDMPSLVELSAARANTLYALVYPRDTWWVKLGLALENFYSWLRRDHFRVFAHSSQAVEALLRRQGFKQCFYRQVGSWQIVIYRR
jgi:magnesium-protoporphyrin O-methyltransferase